MSDMPAPPRQSLADLWRRWGIFFVLAAPVMGLLAINPTFRQYGNLFNVWQQSSIIGVIAIGQTLVIILGGFDLSVGAVAALAGVLSYMIFAMGDGYVMVTFGLTGAILASALVGVLNGILVTRFRITPLIATLGMLSLARGAVLIMSDGRLIYAEGAGFDLSIMLQASILGMPVAGLIFFGFAALIGLLLRRTLFGQYVYAIGGNERAATLAAIPVTKVKVMTYALCSIMAGIGGILLASRTASALPNAGTNYELQAITAAVIGGTALGGGKGSIFGTVLGVILLTAIGNALNLYNVSPFWQTGVTGAILLLAVGFSAIGNGERKA